MMSVQLTVNRSALALACLLTLAACGGGGGGDHSHGPAPSPTPAPPSGNVGGKVLANVVRSGVAGTWGYTAPDGSRYALMGTAKGILVLDLRDTANVRVVDEIDGPTNTSSPGTYWREMRVYGQHAYIVSEQDNFRGGVMILDLSQLPASVRYVKSFTPQDGRLTAHTIDIDTVRGLAYIQRRNGTAVTPVQGPLYDSPGGMIFGGGALRDPGGEHGATPNVGAIEVWDLKTDPENPRYVTTFNRGRNVHDMTAVGEKVYVAEGDAHSFSIWNVSNPSAPVMEVRWSVPGNYAHNIWPSGDGTFVVTTEEVPQGLPARVWRLNGTAEPTQLSSFKVGSGTPHNVVMEGRMAYVSHYTEGAVVMDLTDPAKPNMVLRIDTNPATGSGYAGCWGVYKFPNQPLMACSDMTTGFHLIGIGQ
ncbi:hypothetical protein KY495_18990 [Massilia sp. PAMC28688]|uniref:LVIVD repeat-containing protein n=1 Tax=Massilia sp. PAMC28688 TaxID=2861283 RepID=UPI001C631EFF|nr:hypothetical protein [Massilia sp. PAMC28688]QYF92789.1 hypothetical protein KY495_18990 [Massilia sp. PAMC28688]